MLLLERQATHNFKIDGSPTSSLGLVQLSYACCWALIYRVACGRLHSIKPYEFSNL